jgi:hypothetical protein
MNQGVIFVLLGIFIVWRLYQRTRRNIGRQKLNSRRIILRLVIFGIAIPFIASIGLQYPKVLAGFGIGILAGALIGLVGLRLTRFETTEAGHFYTPDTRIGIAISLLLAGRVLYRLAMAPHSTATGSDHPFPTPSPLTFLIVGLTFGYFLVYFVGLLIHTHDKNSGFIPPPSN